jgi:hypothetical protein
MMSRVPGEEEVQGLDRQQAPVDRLDLVGEGIDGGGLDGGVGVEQVGQLDPARLGGQLERHAVGVEGPAPGLDDLAAVGVGGGDEPVGDPTVIVPVDDVGDSVAVGLHRHDGDLPGRDEAPDPQPALECVEFQGTPRRSAGRRRGARCVRE